jgi:hypothetical protein
MTEGKYNKDELHKLLMSALNQEETKAGIFRCHMDNSIIRAMLDILDGKSDAPQETASRCIAHIVDLMTDKYKADIQC